MTKSALDRRLLKIKLFRRKDIYDSEMFLYNDPRSEKFQWSIDKTRQWLDEQATLVDDIKKKKLTRREDLGLPLSPVDLKQRAMQKMRGSSPAMAAKAEAESQAKLQAQQGAAGERPGVKKPVGPKPGAQERPVDLSEIDSEFMAYKGLQMSKKQKAALAARAAEKKKAASKPTKPKRR